MKPTGPEQRDLGDCSAMKYHGEVFSKHGRLLAIDSTQTNLVVLTVESGDDLMMVSLGPDDARELARHLSRAAAEVSLSKAQP